MAGRRAKGCGQEDDEWYEYWDKNTEDYYYFEVNTGKTQWKKPQPTSNAYQDLAPSLRVTSSGGIEVDGPPTRPPLPLQTQSLSFPDGLYKHKLQHKRQHLRDAERILAFTDAAVAIAITLLVLPLMESAAELWREGHATTGMESVLITNSSTGDQEAANHGSGHMRRYLQAEGEAGSSSSSFTALSWFQGHKHDISLFVMSFAVIFVFWSSHVSGITRFLSFLNFCWLLGIAWMPVSMELNRGVFTTSEPDDYVMMHLQYFGTLLFLQSLAILQTLEVMHNPHTWKQGSLGPRWKQVVSNFVDLVFLLAAMAFSVTPVGYWGLSLLVLSYPLSDYICEKCPDLKLHVGETRTSNLKAID